MDMKLLCVVVLFLVLGYANGIKWKQCGTKSVTKVSVSGCEKTDICILKRGSKVVFTVGFKSPLAASKATTVVHGLLGPIPIPFPVPNPNACQKCGLQCPVKAGQTYMYHTFIDVKTSYPAVQVNVKWEVQNESEKDLFCIIVPVKIV